MKTFLKVLLIMVLAATLIGIVASIFTTDIPKVKTEAERQAEIKDSIAEVHRTNLYLAYEHTRQAIEKGLKAPSTAKFQSYTDAKLLRTSDTTYQVQMWVDAQNSFGAMLRSTYAANFQYSNGKLFLTEIFEVK